jgi:hypothetical protein
MGVGEKYVVDFRGIEVEGLGIFVGWFPASLEQAAVNENTPAEAFQHMAGTCHPSIGSVKR